MESTTLPRSRPTSTGRKARCPRGGRWMDRLTNCGFTTRRWARRQYVGPTSGWIQCPSRRWIRGRCLRVPRAPAVSVHIILVWSSTSSGTPCGGWVLIQTLLCDSISRRRGWCSGAARVIPLPGSAATICGWRTSRWRRGRMRVRMMIVVSSTCRTAVAGIRMCE